MKRRVFLQTILSGFAGVFVVSKATAQPPHALFELKDPLTRDIAANGILRPIIMHNGMVLDGHRRLAAAKALGITKIPCTYV